MFSIHTVVCRILHPRHKMSSSLWVTPSRCQVIPPSLSIPPLPCSLYVISTLFPVSDLSTISAWLDAILACGFFRDGMGTGLFHIEKYIKVQPDVSCISFLCRPSSILVHVCPHPVTYFLSSGYLGCFHSWAPDYCCEHVYTNLTRIPSSLCRRVTVFISKHCHTFCSSHTILYFCQQCTGLLSLAQGLVSLFPVLFSGPFKVVKYLYQWFCLLFPWLVVSHVL